MNNICYYYFVPPALPPSKFRSHAQKFMLDGEKGGKETFAAPRTNGSYPNLMNHFEKMMDRETVAKLFQTEVTYLQNMQAKYA